MQQKKIEIEKGTVNFTSLHRILQENLVCGDIFVHYCILVHLGAVECKRGTLSDYSRPVLLPLTDFCFLYPTYFFVEY